MFVSFSAGLWFLVVDFYQLTQALGTETDLASVSFDSVIIAFLVIVVSLIKSRSKMFSEISLTFMRVSVRRVD